MNNTFKTVGGGNIGLEELVELEGRGCNVVDKLEKPEEAREILKGIQDTSQKKR